jgi:hypothetical protein
MGWDGRCDVMTYQIFYQSSLLCITHTHPSHVTRDTQSGVKLIDEEEQQKIVKQFDAERAALDRQWRLILQCFGVVLVALLCFCIYEQRFAANPIVLQRDRTPQAVVAFGLISIELLEVISAVAYLSTVCVLGVAAERD